jgi:hypothetical protein
MNFAQPLSKLLLILLLLAGNWATAEHNAIADFDHHHNSECIYCLSPATVYSSSPTPIFILELNPGQAVAETSAGFYYTRLASSISIRAPPIH